MRVSNKSTEVKLWFASLYPPTYLGMLESVVAIAFQNVFCVEMLQNNVFFYFLKIIFKISASKRFKSQKKLNY